LICGVAAGALLTACASQSPRPGAVPAVASLSASYVVYPPPGTAAIQRTSSCQLARNIAVPVAKRSSALAECNRLLSRATDPVTKPVLPSATALTSPPLQPAAPDCVSGQLGARFIGGGGGGGNDFGEIVIWNPGAEPCQLHGHVRFAGYYPDGSRDSHAVMAHPLTSAVVTLPSNMPPYRDLQDQSGYLAALLMGPERDDPSQPNALCRPQDEGTPAVLVLSLGSVTIRATNEDRESPQNTSVYGCHGRVLLEGIEGPQR
jgi:hypothetical protein